MTNPDLPHPDMTNPEPPRRRRAATIGVAAGLLAGGAIGLVATMPSLTSAAADTVEEPAALQTVDDTESDTVDEDGSPEERPEPGARLRETLQPLVDDGTIDDGQADAVARHLVENRPEHDGRPGHQRAAFRHAGIVADLIGIEADALREELAAGSSIADVAEANGVDVQVVIDGLVADAEAHAAMRLEHGADEERVAERLEQVTERIEELVYATRGA